jgi:mersacidin/lichenicidin family type 2 lantibiotic
MSKVDVVRAWKDAKYRRSLTPQQLESLPKNPAGRVDVSDRSVRDVHGFDGEARLTTTAWFCTIHSLITLCCH